MDFGFKGIEKVLTKIGEKLNEWSIKNTTSWKV
jgi:hypothetical protein